MYLYSIRTYILYVPIFYMYLYSICTYIIHIPTFYTYLNSIRAYILYVLIFYRYLYSIHTHLLYVPIFYPYPYSIGTYIYTYPFCILNILSWNFSLSCEWTLSSILIGWRTRQMANKVYILSFILVIYKTIVNLYLLNSTCFTLTLSLSIQITC